MFDHRNFEPGLGPALMCDLVRPLGEGIKLLSERGNEVEALVVVLGSELGTCGYLYIKCDFTHFS